MSRKYSHYFKPTPFGAVDVYRVLQLFGVTDPCLQHATKKLLVAGCRGHKDIGRDIQEAIDALLRWQEMRTEELSQDLTTGQHRSQVPEPAATGQQPPEES